MKKRKIIILTSVLGCIVLFFLIINVVNPPKVMDVNPFITDGKPLLCAHRGGGVSNPENTLKAYKKAVEEYDVDILETDLWMTSDKYLVLGHDSSINRTSDVEQVTGSTEEYIISEHTFQELKMFNYGAQFVDEDGNRPYQNLVAPGDVNREEIIEQNDLQLLLVEDLFREFYDNKELLYIVEIKNSGELGFEAADILKELLTKVFPDLQNKVVIGTFHDDIDKYLKTECSELMRGASTKVATKFIITQLLKVNLFDTDNFACLQIPVSQNVKLFSMDLTWKTYINRAHRRNIAVQYWTINDADEMRKLISLGCDAIMTDNPKLLKEILLEK